MLAGGGGGGGGGGGAVVGAGLLAGWLLFFACFGCSFLGVGDLTSFTSFGAALGAGSATTLVSFLAADGFANPSSKS